MRYTITLLILLLGGVGGYYLFQKASPVATTQKWVSYTNNTLGVSFEYPSDLVKPPQGVATSSASFPLLNPSPRAPEDNGIFVDTDTTKEPDAASYIRSQKWQVAEGLATSTTVDGIPAVEILETAYEYMTLYVVHNGKFYSFRLNTSPDEAEHIKSSIRFLN